MSSATKYLGWMQTPFGANSKVVRRRRCCPCPPRDEGNGDAEEEDDDDEGNGDDDERECILLGRRNNVTIRSRCNKPEDNIFILVGLSKRAMMVDLLGNKTCLFSDITKYDEQAKHR